LGALGCAGTLPTESHVALETAPLALVVEEDGVAEYQAVAARSPDGAELVWSVVESPSHGALELAVDGSGTYRPSADYYGLDEALLAVSAGDETVTMQLTIEVSSVNDAPVATSLFVTTSEDTPLEARLVAIDPDDTELTVALSSLPLHGRLELSVDGSFVYTPDLDFVGTDTFLWSAFDASGAQSPTSTAEILVLDTDDAPVAVDAAYTLQEDTVLSGVVAASDPDGDPVVLAITSPVAHGQLDFNTATGAFEYTPWSDFAGADQFMFTATAGQLTSAAATVDLQVLSVNDAPLAIDGSGQTLEDQSLSLQLEASDPEGSTLAWSLVASASDGVATLSQSGELSYIPDPDFHGSDTVWFTVSDGQASSEAAQVTLVVDAVNDAPSLADVYLVTEEDVVASTTLVATEPDGDVLSFGVVAEPAHGLVSLDGTSGALSYVPDPGFVGTDGFLVSVDDGALQDTASITVEVRSVGNEAPTVDDVFLSMQEDDELTHAMVGTDGDGDALIWTIVTYPAHGSATLDRDTGVVVYRPDLDYAGPDSLQVTASDDLVSSSYALVSVEVLPVNDQPVIHSWPLVVNEDSTSTGVLDASDVDGDTLLWAVTVPPSSGTLEVTPDTGAWVYSPDPDFAGEDRFTAIVSDGTVDSEPTDIDLIVVGLADSPIVDPAVVVVDEDTVGTVTLTGTDVDGDSLTWAIRVQPVNGTATLQPNTGDLTYTPHEDFNGDDVVYVEAHDGVLASASTPVSVVVLPVADPPVVLPVLVATTVEDESVSGVVEATDPDGDVLTWSTAIAPTHGEVTVFADGSYVYTPDPDFYGDDSFDAQVSDGMFTVPATVSVVVAASGDGPVVDDLFVETAQDVTVVGSLSASDVDDDPLTFGLTVAPSRGTASVAADGTFEYTPDALFVGVDVFTISVSDGDLEDLGVVTVDVLSDADGDTVPDRDDTCVDDPDPDLSDANDNGIGDACDCLVDSTSDAVDTDVWGSWSAVETDTGLELLGPSWVQTVPYDATGCADVTWSGWLAGASGNLEVLDDLTLEGRVDGGAWLELQTWTGSEIYDEARFYTETLAWAGVVELRFQLDADYGEGVFVGDFTLGCDSDGDTVTDCEETLLGSAPDHVDGDGDGVQDDVELSAGWDPMSSDTDGDGVADGVDLCPATWDSGQEDWDGDGVGQACEWGFYDALSSFSDPVHWEEWSADIIDVGSGYGMALNGEEQPVVAYAADVSACAAVGWYTTVDNQDTSGTDDLRIEGTIDGGARWETLDELSGSVGYAWEVWMGTTLDPRYLRNGLQLRIRSTGGTYGDWHLDDIGLGCDNDLDGIVDAVEEKLLGTSAELFDTDADLIGDGEELLAGTDPLSDDLDGDGVSDLTDNCIATPNADQDDSLGDGLGDACRTLIEEDFEGAPHPLWETDQWSNGEYTTHMPYEGDHAYVMQWADTLLSKRIVWGECPSGKVAWRYMFRWGMDASSGTYDDAGVRLYHYTSSSGIGASYAYFTEKPDGHMTPWYAVYGKDTTDGDLGFALWSDANCSAYFDDLVVMCDADGDGLGDSDEYLHGTDLLVKDTDGDGTQDLDEVLDGTDPLDASSF